jgi:hypothetical protein
MLKTWQAEKKKYGIPGKVIKAGQFGDRMDKLAKAYNSAGGLHVDISNAAKVQQILDQGIDLADEWLKKAQTMKPGEFTNKNGAIELVTGYRQKFEGTASRVRQTVDPLHEPRLGLKKAIALYKDAITHPADYRTLMELWDNGARQYVGQGFKIAVKNADTLGYTSNVVNLLKQYDKIVSKWMDTMLNGADAKKAAADPDQREEFLNDMHQAFAIAASVLKATAK